MAVQFDHTVRDRATQGIGDLPFGNDGMEAITKSKEAIQTVASSALHSLELGLNRVGQHGSNLKNRVAGLDAAGGSPETRHPLEWKALFAVLAAKQDKPCAISAQSEAHAEGTKKRKHSRDKRVMVEIKEQKSLLVQYEDRVMEIKHEDMLKTLP